MIRPIRITQPTDKELCIEWEDGDSTTYRLSALRRACPCATCAADAEGKPASYIPLFSKEAMRLERISPVGHYALQFIWKDGHDTGIYSYEYLRSAGAAAPEA
jgi:DUF971 family protein